MSMESSPSEEPQLISSVKHEGSVTDIKVNKSICDVVRFSSNIEKNQNQC